MITPSATNERIEGRLEGELGRSLQWQGWPTPADPRAVVVIAHGAFEHGARYAHVARAFVEAGFATYTLDHRGHGRSEGPRGNVERIAYVVADLDRLATLAMERHPGRGLFLLGHSVGGAIALEYALEHQERLDGLILSGPAVDVSAVSAGQVLISRALSAITPNLGILKIDSSKISRDPAVVRAYDDDPLVYRGRGPVRSVAEIIAAARRLPKRLARLRLPLLIVHGAEDRLVAPAGSRMVHDEVGSADKTLKLYPGLYHEVLNEPEQETVIGDMIGWLERRIVGER